MHPSTIPILWSRHDSEEGSRGSRKGSSMERYAHFLGFPTRTRQWGSRLFKKPVNKTAWSGVFDASQFGYACHQVVDTVYPGFPGSEMWNPNVNVSEDCLNLNIWTPATRENDSLAVMVWIFGGGFYYGCGSLDVYNGEVLSLKENVVVVTLNYRVASLGFLAMGGSDYVPGNMGLYWPSSSPSPGSRITSDYSEGIRAESPYSEKAQERSASICIWCHHLVGTCLTGAILESGSSVVPWGIISNEEALRRGLTLAERVSCYTPKGITPTGEDIGCVIDCLRGVSPEELIAEEFVVEGTYIFPFVPVVDGEFLTETPTSAVTKGRFQTGGSLAWNQQQMRDRLSWCTTYQDSIKIRTSLINRICIPWAHSVGVTVHEWVRSRRGRVPVHQLVGPLRRGNVAPMSPKHT